MEGFLLLLLQPMELRFTKMQGLGNDFVVIDAIHQPVSLDAERVRRLARRRFGIGCDQVLLVEPPTPGSGAEFRYRIYNADGGEVEQCGNGARCFARFVHDKGLTRSNPVRVETLAGIIELHLGEHGEVTVDMGAPRLEPKEIPFIAEGREILYPIEVEGERLEIAALSMGNPHAVLRVSSVEEAPVERLGPLLERHPRFPRGANVGFMEVVARDHVRLRVHERGAGETLACGTGACAAVVAGRLQGLLDERVAVDLPGGRLVISWGEVQAPVLMTGPAETVFEGWTTL